MGWQVNTRTGERRWVDPQSAPARGTAIPIGPRDPTAPLKAPQIRADIGNTQAGAARTRVQTQGDVIGNQIAGATLQDAIREKRALANLAETNAAVAARNAAGPPALTPQQVADRDRRAKLATLVNQLNHTQSLFGSTMKREPYGWASSLGEYLPTETNTQFDAAAAKLSQLGQSTFRTPGQGDTSEKEAAAFDKASTPSRWNNDSTTAEQLRGMRAQVEQEYKALGLPPPKWTGLPPSKPQGKPTAPRFLGFEDGD